jgi:hypothetical protein
MCAYSAARSAARALLVAVTASLATGCSDAPHAPSVWFANPGSPLVAQGWSFAATVQYSDDGSDVSTGRVAVKDASGAVLLDAMEPIDGLLGESSGALEISLGTVDGPCGVYTLTVWLGDAADRWSEPASMEFRVVAGFRPGVEHALPGLNRPRVALGDLDGDGRRDVAAASGSLVAAWLQTTAGTLAAPLVADVGGIARGIAAGDVDGDGRAEIVVAGVLPDAPLGAKARLAVVDAAVAGLSVAASLALGTDEAGPLVLADLDRDGDLDAAAVRESTSAAQLVVLAQAAGALAAPVPLEGEVWRGAEVAAGDLDGDGGTDLVVQAPGGIAVLRQASAGTFAALEPYDVGAFGTPVSITTGDVDGDGLADALVSGGSGAAVLLGRASGPFELASASGRGVLADLDADGLAEAVSFSGTSLDTGYTVDGPLLGRGFGFIGPSSLYEPSSSGATAVGDVTGDGAPDVVAAHADGMLYVVPHW